MSKLTAIGESASTIDISPRVKETVSANEKQKQTVGVNEKSVFMVNWVKEAHQPSASDPVPAAPSKTLGGHLFHQRWSRPVRDDHHCHFLCLVRQKTI